MSNETTQALRDRYEKSKDTVLLIIEVRLKGDENDPWREIPKGHSPQWFDGCDYREKK